LFMLHIFYSSGKMINKMVKELKNGQMVLGMKVTIKRGKKMGKG